MRFGFINEFFKHKKIKLFFKKLQLRKKNIYLIILLLLIVLTSVVLMLPPSSHTPAVKNNPDLSANPNDLKLLLKNEVTLWINQGGPYDRDFYFHKNEKITITLDITKETQDSILPLADELVNKDMISIQVDGANEIKEFKIVKGMHGKVDYDKGDGKLRHGQSVQLTTSYIAKKAGKDIVKVAIKGTSITYESHLFILDSSYFTIPINLEASDISFTTGNFLSIKSQKKKQPDPSPRSGAWWSIDYPGNITYEFTSNEQKFDNAYLTVYTIADGALQKYNANDPLNNFLYLKNLHELTKLVSEKPNLEPSQLSIIDFPPINAGPGSVSHISYLDFQNGTGISYLIPGWFQALGEADFPTYTYQGITSDGKYQIFFRYSKLYSPRLDNYVKINKNKFDYNKDQNKYIHGSFDEVAKEENFSPSIEELDQFVKSIKIGK